MSDEEELKEAFEEVIAANTKLAEQVEWLILGLSRARGVSMKEVRARMDAELRACRLEGDGK